MVVVVEYILSSRSLCFLNTRAASLALARASRSWKPQLNHMSESSSTCTGHVRWHLCDLQLPRFLRLFQLQPPQKALHADRLAHTATALQHFAAAHFEVALAAAAAHPGGGGVSMESLDIFPWARFEMLCDARDGKPGKASARLKKISDDLKHRRCVLGTGGSCHKHTHTQTDGRT